MGTTARDKFFYTRTLCCLLKSLEGTETEIELRNDSSVKGTIEFVSAAMSVTMKNCVLIANERPKRLQQLSIQGRKIRMVLIPDYVNILYAMQGVIDMYNAPVLGKFEYRRLGRGRGRGVARGDRRGRGRNRGRDLQKDTLQGDRRGRGLLGRGSTSTNLTRGQALGGRSGAGTESVSGSTGSGGYKVVQNRPQSQQILTGRLLAVSMGMSQHSIKDSGEGMQGSGDATCCQITKQPGTDVVESKSDASHRSMGGRDSSPELHKKTEHKRQEIHSHSEKGRGERQLCGSDSSDSDRHGRKKREHRHSSRSSECNVSDGESRHKSSHHSADVGGIKDLRNKLSQRKSVSDAQNRSERERQSRGRDYRGTRESDKRLLDWHGKFSGGSHFESEKKRDRTHSPRRPDSRTSQTHESRMKQTPSSSKDRRRGNKSSESDLIDRVEHRNRGKCTPDSESKWHSSATRPEVQDRKSGSGREKLSDSSGKERSRRGRNRSPRDDSKSGRSAEYHGTPNVDCHTGKEARRHALDKDRKTSKDKHREKDRR